MSGRRGLTRRGVLAAGGAGAAGAAIAGLPGAALGQRARQDPEDPRNVLVIMASSLRWDYVGAYDDSVERANTPNLDELAKQSLRFEHAVAESMPTIPARRALLTGMRSYPFRDWQATDGLPGRPGWNPIVERRQPIVTGVMSEAGITTAYATDNPFLIGPHFANFRETVDFFEGQTSQPYWGEYNRRWSRPASRDEIRNVLLPALRGTAEERRLREHVGWNAANRRSEQDYSAARVVRDGIGLLGRLKDRQPFFLGVDMFDPTEPFDPPESYRDDIEIGGVLPIQPFGQQWSKVEDMGLDDGDIAKIRDLYAASVTFVDAWIGRLLDELDNQGLAENTLVMFLSDHGVTLGERGVLGRRADRAYHEVYRVPFMVRDPEGRRSGEDTEWFAMTHDVPATAMAYLGVTCPGKCVGEDLNVFFEDEEDPPRRRFWTTAMDTTVMVGDEDWMLAATDQGTIKYLYETDEDENQDEDILQERPDVEDRLWRFAATAAGGTLPQFNAEGATRPRPELEDEDDFDGDDETDTADDEDLEDQQDATQGSGVSGNTQNGLGAPPAGNEVGYVLACGCGLILMNRLRKYALDDAQAHFDRFHPELAESTPREDLLREL
jgi:arylsulfatase A-like enzyme